MSRLNSAPPMNDVPDALLRPVNLTHRLLCNGKLMVFTSALDTQVAVAMGLPHVMPSSDTYTATSAGSEFRIPWRGKNLIRENDRVAPRSNQAECGYGTPDGHH